MKLTMTYEWPAQRRRATAAVWRAKAEEAGRQLLDERNPRRRRLLERATVAWGNEAVLAERMPEGRRWLIGGGLFTGLSAGLLLVPSWLSPWTDVSPQMTVAALGLPAALTVAARQGKAALDAYHERRRDELHPTARLGERMVQNAERQREADTADFRDPVRMTPVRPAGRVIEGEVVR